MCYVVCVGVDEQVCYGDEWIGVVSQFGSVFGGDVMWVGWIEDELDCIGVELDGVVDVGWLGQVIQFDMGMV